MERMIDRWLNFLFREMQLMLSQLPSFKFAISLNRCLIYAASIMRKLFICFALALIGFPAFCQAPRIVNIVNFIRLLEPRDPAITEDVLYETVVKQVDLMKKYHLGGTFLLQYDALMDPRYQKLLKQLPKDSFEIGAWWEIPQPLVEHSGMKWRGRYPWDWRANIGFSTGYTQTERRKLIDTYMQNFKRIFGYYPKSVASWFIDAYSLSYMYTKYHIVASANCKDQYGTDGYTLWGGYWNQAYYPSKLNAYMPAQHAEAQIPVPIFRMLGSDPIRQYDNGLGSERQGVITLEPVYPKAGGDQEWIDWFFKQFVNGPSMAFAYTQAGQENSFTWAAMEKGLAMQFPLIEKLRDEKKVRVETLAASGEWFKSHFKVTPSTSVSATEDLPRSNQKTIWFDSRFYRANLLWDDGTLRFRDIHLFDEKMASGYESKPVTSNECKFFTLPLVDGYLWSTKEITAGLKFKTSVDGKDSLIRFGNPTVSDREQGKLIVSWPVKTFKGTLKIVFTDQQITMSMLAPSGTKWFLDLDAGKDVKLPFRKISAKGITAQFEGMSYQVGLSKGKTDSHKIFGLIPDHNQILMSLGTNK